MEIEKKDSQKEISDFLLQKGFSQSDIYEQIYHEGDNTQNVEIHVLIEDSIILSKIYFDDVGKSQYLLFIKFINSINKDYVNIISANSYSDIVFFSIKKDIDIIKYIFNLIFNNFYGEHVPIKKIYRDIYSYENNDICLIHILKAFEKELFLNLFKNFSFKIERNLEKLICRCLSNTYELHNVTFHQSSKGIITFDIIFEGNEIKFENFNKDGKKSECLFFYSRKADNKESIIFDGVDDFIYTFFDEAFEKEEYAHENPSKRLKDQDDHDSDYNEFYHIKNSSVLKKKP